MKQFVQNEEAVSPVIGVILMVAITVILAAVIAAFVFGMTGNVQTTKTIAVTAGQNSNDVVLTYQGGADATALQYFKVTVTPSTGSAVTNYAFFEHGDADVTQQTAEPGSITFDPLPVGTVITISSGTSGQDHVVVVGHFTDGSDQVVLDTYV
ncbi:flagellin domain protein [Methanofollis liminatans DSM 4140]|uniref:Flagellin domain protein n=1 Tax=Methanofollis liminatans DSM 4140 TaxID=28892 RepID=J1L3E6_9EURY|nr:type IV pilin N-terminal domain-containing protein [Methanofollis liminatans]EJG07607.1 flagellin domain protein [Methanofollis liminatans DSM 4140]